MIRVTSPTPTRGAAPSHSPPDVRFTPGLGLARFLGYFSLGLGLAEVLAPKAVGRFVGVDQPHLIEAYGVREIVCGIGILSSQRPASWMWARVGGDALDLATLGASKNPPGALIAAAAVAGVTLLDLVSATQLSAAEAMEG